MAEEDLLFGKNRHMFGGIQPSNMKTFTYNGTVLEAVLPDNTVIDNQKLCTVAGVVTRRKADGYPVDEFDGEFFREDTANFTVTNVNGELDGYYYSAFPYSTQGVYNRNKTDANRADSVSHPCNPMLLFTANKSTDAISIILYGQLPSDAVGATIRRSTSFYPATEAEGDLVTTLTATGTFIDTNIQKSHTYYYAAFPYNSYGTYNRDPSNRATVTINQWDYLYGYDINLADSNPATRVTYPMSVDNVAFTPAKMNFGGAFDYGSWPSTPGNKFMPRPCVLNFNGTVSCYLDPNNYAKKVDGSASNISQSSLSGNAMMEWPKIYAKRWEDNGVYHFRCSEYKVDEDYECWCNYDKSNNEIDHFYTAIYISSVFSGQLRSLSNQAISGNLKVATEVSGALQNGSDWYTEVLGDRMLINDLLVMLGKSTDCQSVFGTGVTSSGAKTPGLNNDKGLFWGSNDKASGVKVFGMEDYWGNMYRRIAGWVSDRGSPHVKFTRGTKDGTTVDDYNPQGNGYRIFSGGNIPSGTYSAYISKCVTLTFGRLPCVASGSATTYEADGLWCNGTERTYAMVGGDKGNGELAGPFCSNLYEPHSTIGTNIGAALSCKPSK